MIRLLPALFCSILFTSTAFAESCLNDDIKRDTYADGDSRSSTYVKCKATTGTHDNSYNSLNAIGKQMQGMMERRNTDNGYSDAERAANRRELDNYKDQQSARRSTVKYGAHAELGGIDYANYQYANANITADRQQAIRQEISTVITAGKFLDTYGATNYANADVWKSSTDTAQRWKNCEVATQLVRAYVYGNFIKPEQKNPALGYEIAKAGKQQNCGGTAYWLGRIFEAGDALVPNIDKDKNEINGGKGIKSSVESSYDTAILNGYTPAYERMAELYRLGGPERFRGTKHFVLSDFASYPNWRNPKNDNDQMFLMRVQYSKCLEADPANLVCARGLAIIYADQGKDFGDGYTNYNSKLASFYADYAKELEAKLVKAGIALPPAS